MFGMHEKGFRVSHLRNAVPTRRGPISMLVKPMRCLVERNDDVAILREKGISKYGLRLETNEYRWEVEWYQLCGIPDDHYGRGGLSGLKINSRTTDQGPSVWNIFRNSVLHKAGAKVHGDGSSRRVQDHRAVAGIQKFLWLAPAPPAKHIHRETFCLQTEL